VGFPSIISTIDNDGREVMGPTCLVWKYPSSAIVSGSLLTVESNHFAIVKSRGAVLGVHETGQYPLTTGDKPIVGNIVSGFFGGQSPWQYEIVYVNRAKLVVSACGLALSREMAEMQYDCDYYIHVPQKEDAVRLIQHMPYDGHFLTTKAVNEYAGPVVEQAINQVVQLTPLESVNEKIHEITDLVRAHLGEFLGDYGITLDTVKVLVRPSDERMRTLISLQALGLDAEKAVRYYTAMEMAIRGVVSAPNMACGEPFNVGGTPMFTTPNGMADVTK
jgi:membrane protease subunit (stomatin/prohibitin family)